MDRRRPERERESLLDPIAKRVLEEALGEIEPAEPARTPEMIRPTATRSRFRIGAAVAAVLLLLTGVFVSRRVAPAPLIEETFTLRCIPAHEAAEMLRPILLRSGSISFSMRIPTELKIGGTPEQLRQARSILAEQDVPGSIACPMP